ncbi:MAG: HD-GYP domain-containing protein [Candidatus Xenobia bacterium]
MNDHAISGVTSQLRQFQRVDPETYAHCHRVSEMARGFAEHLGWSPQTCDQVALGAQLHDLGKLDVEPLVHKHGPLTPQEWDVMHHHPENGLARLPKLPAAIRDEILFHHEKWDGSGYHHLRGSAIPDAAQVVALADVYDALRSARSYKDAMSVHEVRQQMATMGGSHFSPRLLNQFLEYLPPA